MYNCKDLLIKKMIIKAYMDYFCLFMDLLNNKHFHRTKLPALKIGF